MTFIVRTTILITVNEHNFEKLFWHIISEFYRISQILHLAQVSISIKRFHHMVLPQSAEAQDQQNTP